MVLRNRDHVLLQKHQGEVIQIINMRTQHHEVIYKGSKGSSSGLSVFTNLSDITVLLILVLVKQ